LAAAVEWEKSVDKNIVICKKYKYKGGLSTNQKNQKNTNQILLAVGC
jgi:hypothetical protein